jgi:hypothetical protein
MQQPGKYGVTRPAQVPRRSFDMLAAGETSPLARMELPVSASGVLTPASGPWSDDTPSSAIPEVFLDAPAMDARWADGAEGQDVAAAEARTHVKTYPCDGASGKLAVDQMIRKRWWARKVAVRGLCG